MPLKVFDNSSYYGIIPAVDRKLFAGVLEIDAPPVGLENKLERWGIIRCRKGKRTCPITRKYLL